MDVTLTSELDTRSAVRAVLCSESAKLIRDEVRAARQRSALERAVREAVTLLGVTVAEASEASGLTPDEIQRVLAHDPDLDAVAGVV